MLSLSLLKQHSLHKMDVYYYSFNYKNKGFLGVFCAQIDIMAEATILIQVFTSNLKHRPPSTAGKEIW
jgi:hypothetical protein